MNDTTNHIETAETNKASFKKREWEYTDSHLRANLPGSDDPKPSENTTTRHAEILQRLNSPVPAEYADLIAEHSWLDYLRHYYRGSLSPAIRESAASRSALVAKAINAITGADQRPVVMTAQQLGHARAGQANRPAMRAAQLSRYKSAIQEYEKNPAYFLGLDICPHRQLASHLVFLLTKPHGVSLEIGMLRERLARYEMKRMENFGLLYPTERLEEIRHELRACNDATRINELHVESTQLSSDAVKASSRAMWGELLSEWEKVQEAVNWLLNVSLMTLQETRENWAEGEKTQADVYHPMGLGATGKYKPTIFVTAFDAAIAEFENALNPPQVARPSAAFMPDGHNTALDHIFGLPILPD
jgi:hypothetical protein